MAVSDIRSAAPMARPMPPRPDHPRPVEARRAEPPRAAPQRVEHRQEAVRVQEHPAPTSKAKGRHVDIRA
jgi:hypothetical protein